MHHFNQGERVWKTTTNGGIWTGEVLGQFQKKNGEVFIVCENNSYIFISDPSHLRRVCQDEVSNSPMAK